MEPDQFKVLLSPDYIIRSILKVHRFIKRHIRARPDLAFRKTFLKANDGSSKPFLRVDLDAEEMFIDTLTTRFGGKNIFVVGEESLFAGEDLTNESRVCVLIDMIDGTDLLERGFSNWCSAVIVFQPHSRSIEGAFIALPNDYLYFATSVEVGKKRLSDRSRSEEVVPLAGPANRILKDASVCMYTQKSGGLQKLISLREKTRFMEWLVEISKIERVNRRTGTTEEIGFRFYNLSGNPMRDCKIFCVNEMMELLTV